MNPQGTYPQGEREDFQEWKERELYYEAQASNQPRERKDMKDKQKLKEYSVSSRSCRPIGSIGCMQPVTVYVEAASPEDALLKAYDQIEHISSPIIKEIQDES
tara:strand:- start:61 stop:369 length:309 start_codon:yes stop_codon:yes gene_type:complete